MRGKTFEWSKLRNWYQQKLAPCYKYFLRKCGKAIQIFLRAITLFGPFGNLGIGISASALAVVSASALRKFYFCLTKCLMKNKTFMWNTLKYSFLHLVMRHQYPSVKITYFSTNSYHISTKIPSKRSIMESFLGTIPSLTRSFSCYLEQPFCGEQVSTCFCRNDSTGDVILGVLKTR